MYLLDTNILRDAQKHPEAYPNLMVRVAGFAAYFIDLDKNLQEAIIDRTPHSACSAGL